MMEREIRKNSHFLSALNYILNFQPAEISSRRIMLSIARDGENT